MKWLWGIGFFGHPALLLWMAYSMQKESPRKNTIQFPRSFFKFVVVGISFLIFMILYTIIEKNDIAVALAGFLPFIISVSGASIWLASFKIRIFEEGFYYRNFLYKTRWYSYDEVEIEFTGKAFLIKKVGHKRRLFGVSYLYDNTDVLLDAYDNYMAKKKKEQKRKKITEDTIDTIS